MPVVGGMRHVIRRLWRIVPLQMHARSAHRVSADFSVRGRWHAHGRYQTLLSSPPRQQSSISNGRCMPIQILPGRRVVGPPPAASSFFNEELRRAPSSEPLIASESSGCAVLRLAARLVLSNGESVIDGQYFVFFYFDSLQFSHIAFLQLTVSLGLSRAFLGLKIRLSQRLCARREEATNVVLTLVG